MNSFMTLKTALLGGMLVTAMALTGCKADGDGTVGPGNGIGGGGSSDGTGTCDVPVGDICVAGGHGSTKALVDELLNPNGGPLGPVADSLDPATGDLQNEIITLLQNDGDLASLVENLLQGTDGKKPNLELALASLLDGGLNDILLQEGLLDPETISAAFGEDGLTGVVQTLLQKGRDTNCQAALSTICLLGGNGGKMGLLDAIITDDGALADLAANLAVDDLSGTLADLLENNDGSLQTLVGNLFAEGHLMEGLQTLLDPNQQGSLVDALGDLLAGDPRNSDKGDLIQQLLNGIGNLIGATP